MSALFLFINNTGCAALGNFTRFLRFGVLIYKMGVWEVSALQVVVRMAVQVCGARGAAPGTRPQLHQEGKKTALNSGAGLSASVWAHWHSYLCSSSPSSLPATKDREVPPPE